MTVPDQQRRGVPERSRIAICGGGVAAIEALLAVRSLLGLAPEVDLIAPNRRFVYQPLAVAEPFGLAQTRQFDLATAAADYGATLHRAELASVDAEKHRITISEGTRLRYDRLIVAVGARRCAWLPGALHFTGAADVDAFRAVLDDVAAGAVSGIAFAAPTGATWTLPTYELALLTASWVAEQHLTDIELTIVTPEDGPLASFGTAASRALRSVLSDRGIRLHFAATAEEAAPGVLRLIDGTSFPVDRVVASPKLEGPWLPGLPADDAGFVATDEYSRVVGLADVYAAGDVTAFPVKQGGIATQQVDAAVEAIAAELGAGIRPSPFQPVLRGMLLTGVAPTYLRTALGDERAGLGELAADPLWWPPTKIAGRYLGPYLAGLAEGEAREAGAPEPGPPAPPPPSRANQRHARELALSFALADANSEDYRSALRWLDVVEQLEGALPPGYEERRLQWQALAQR